MTRHLCLFLLLSVITLIIQHVSAQCNAVPLPDRSGELQVTSLNVGEYCWSVSSESVDETTLLSWSLRWSSAELYEGDIIQVFNKGAESSELSRLQGPYSSTSSSSLSVAEPMLVPARPLLIQLICRSGRASFTLEYSIAETKGAIAMDSPIVPNVRLSPSYYSYYYSPSMGGDSMYLMIAVAGSFVVCMIILMICCCKKDFDYAYYSSEELGSGGGFAGTFLASFFFFIIGYLISVSCTSRMYPRYGAHLGFYCSVLVASIVLCAMGIGSFYVSVPGFAASLLILIYGLRAHRYKVAITAKQSSTNSPGMSHSSVQMVVVTTKQSSPNTNPLLPPAAVDFNSYRASVRLTPPPVLPTQQAQPLAYGYQAQTFAHSLPSQTQPYAPSSPVPPPPLQAAPVHHGSPPSSSIAENVPSSSSAVPRGNDLGARREALQKSADMDKFLHLGTTCAPLAPDTVEYAAISDRFTQSALVAHKRRFVVTGVDRIYTPQLAKKFWDRVSQLRDPRVNEHDLKFHGTNPTALASIVHKGFVLPEKSDRLMYGQGIYFANNSSKSDLYCSGWSEPHRKMLLCVVALGNVMAPTQPMNSLTPSDVFDGGFDSVFASRGTAVRFDEYAIFDPAQALPKYIVHYDAFDC